MSKAVDKTLVYEDNDKYIFRAQGRANKPQKMYYDSQGIVYKAGKCREPTEDELRRFKETEERYGNELTAISL